jgi:hypothetical protein
MLSADDLRAAVPAGVASAGSCGGIPGGDLCGDSVKTLGGQVAHEAVHAPELALHPGFPGLGFARCSFRTIDGPLRQPVASFAQSRILRAFAKSLHQTREQRLCGCDGFGSSGLFGILIAFAMCRLSGQLFASVAIHQSKNPCDAESNIVVTTCR